MSDYKIPEIKLVRPIAEKHMADNKVTKILTAGKYDKYNAIRVVADFKGGGFANWRIPKVSE